MFLNFLLLALFSVSVSAWIDYPSDGYGVLECSIKTKFTVASYTYPLFAA